jgi:hypothetical protein
MEKPVWDANLSSELRDGIVQCIRSAQRWEFRGDLPNGARIRITNVGDTAKLRELLIIVADDGNGAKS